MPNNYLFDYLFDDLERMKLEEKAIHGHVVVKVAASPEVLYVERSYPYGTALPMCYRFTRDNVVLRTTGRDGNTYYYSGPGMAVSADVRRYVDEWLLTHVGSPPNTPSINSVEQS